MATAGSDEIKKIMEYRISDEPWYRKNVLKWGLYDLGNTIYSMVVVSLTIVPLTYILLYNSRGSLGFISDGDDAVNMGNLLIAITFFISNILMAMISPFLGAYADYKEQRRPLLLKITTICLIFMAALYVSVFEPNIIWILLIFLIANLFYQMGLVVYDSMLPFVTDNDSLGKVAGFGIAIGYFGSFIGIALGFLLVAIGFDNFVTEPAKNGKPDEFVIGYIPYIFPLAAFLFLVFIIPMFTLKEKPRLKIKKSFDNIRSDVINNVKSTAKEVRYYRNMLLFLIGWLIFIDAANTIIAFMAPMILIGLEFDDETILRIVLGIGILSAIILTYPVGLYVNKNGPRKGLVLVTILWLVSLVIGMLTNLNTESLSTPKWPVYIFPIVLGPALGGTWVVQRQFITELAPPEKVGNYFGFANIFGRISSAVGPFVWFISVFTFNEIVGWSQAFSNRISILVLAILMIIGFIILLKVDDVHDVYLKGGRATGEGTWVNSDGEQIYPDPKSS